MDGDAIAKKFGMQAVVLVNDFTAAGFGVANIQSQDLITLGNSEEARQDPNGVRILIGPGTGLGLSILFKDTGSNSYEPSPSEGGHLDFSVKSEEDFELMNFTKQFKAESNNIENLRNKGPIDRVSVERLCAGPGVPLIYAFMKKKHPDLESKLENYMKFDDISSKDVIGLANAT